MSISVQPMALVSLGGKLMNNCWTDDVMYFISIPLPQFIFNAAAVVDNDSSLEWRMALMPDADLIKAIKMNQCTGHPQTSAQSTQFAKHRQMRFAQTWWCKRNLPITLLSCSHVELGMLITYSKRNDNRNRRIIANAACWRDISSFDEIWYETAACQWRNIEQRPQSYWF